VTFSVDRWIGAIGGFVTSGVSEILMMIRRCESYRANGSFSRSANLRFEMPPILSS
jgi:hypothetical protein